MVQRRLKSNLTVSLNCDDYLLTCHIKFAYTENVRIRFSTYDLQITNSSFQVFFDIVLLGLPLPFIFKTRLAKQDRSKIKLKFVYRSDAKANVFFLSSDRLLFIYILCFVSLIATSIRFYHVTEFSIYDSQISTIQNRQRHMYWAQIELVTAIICANLPAIPHFLRHFWRSAKSIVSPSSLERYTQSSTNYHSNKSGVEHKDNSQIPNRRSRCLVGRKLSALRQNTGTDTTTTSPSTPKFSTSQPDLPEEKDDDAFANAEAIAMELVPRQKGSAHKTEIVSSAVVVGVSNGSDGNGNNGRFSLPSPTRAHRQQDIGRTVTGGRDFDASNELGQRIIRTDQVDVESSLA